jgi:hypothetical protein
VGGAVTHAIHTKNTTCPLTNVIEEDGATDGRRLDSPAVLPRQNLRGEDSLLKVP